MKPGNLIQSRYPRTSVLHGNSGVSFLTRRWKDVSTEDIGLVISKVFHPDDNVAKYTTYDTLALIGDALYYIRQQDFRVILK